MTSLQTTLLADALRPGDEGYDAAARTFFATGQPALVVRPREPDEVAAALRHATAHGMAVSVRSGGHSPVGHSTNTGGMVIDLRRLDHVEILDTERRLVRVGGGATWGRVAAALAPYRWAITAGDTSDVGVGGLTLGGGIGWMVRQHGLAIDNLVGRTGGNRRRPAPHDLACRTPRSVLGSPRRRWQLRRCRRLRLRCPARRERALRDGGLPVRRPGRPDGPLARRDADGAGGAVEHSRADAADARREPFGSRASLLRAARPGQRRPRPTQPFGPCSSWER